MSPQGKKGALKGLWSFARCGLRANKVGVAAATFLSNAGGAFQDKSES